MSIDPLLLLAPVLLAVGIVCATVVCVVALCRAHRTDTVAVVRALPELAATFCGTVAGGRADDALSFLAADIERCHRLPRYGRWARSAYGRALRRPAARRAAAARCMAACSSAVPSSPCGRALRRPAPTARRTAVWSPPCTGPQPVRVELEALQLPPWFGGAGPPVLPVCRSPPGSASRRSRPSLRGRPVLPPAPGWVACPAAPLRFRVGASYPLPPPMRSTRALPRASCPAKPTA